MTNQVLTIEPQNELKFKGTFELGCTTYLRLGNPTSDTVLFKIKTTAPKKYCVRPNSGSIEPKARVEIAITPQPVYLEPSEKHKHKFMVQSVIAPEGKTNVDQVWKEISPEQLMDYKLKCVFESPRPANTNLNDSGDSGAQNEARRRVVEEARPAAKEPVENIKNSDDQNQQNGEGHSRSVNAEMNLTFPKPENAEIEVNNASNEVTHTREEENKLRNENLQLKEELLRLRQMWGDGRAHRAHPFGPEKQAQGNVMPWIATAVAMALLGIIIGKFFM